MTTLVTPETNVQPTTSRPRRGSVDRLMRSVAFRRSREAAALMLDDPHALHALVTRVAQRDYRHGHLAGMSGHIDAALGLMRHRIETLSDTGVPELNAAQAARHRLIVAALYYLSRSSDVIPDGHTYGDIDDAVIVREVLCTVEAELIAYFPGQVELKGGAQPRRHHGPESTPETVTVPGWRQVRGPQSRRRVS